MIPCLCPSKNQRPGKRLTVADGGSPHRQHFGQVEPLIRKAPKGVNRLSVVLDDSVHVGGWGNGVDGNWGVTTGHPHPRWTQFKAGIITQVRFEMPPQLYTTTRLCSVEYQWLDTVTE